MSGSASASHVLGFDIFQLDLRAGELRKQGVKLRLQGQPLQVLAALLRRAGHVVTRDELRMELWAADTFVDFDHSLHNAIARIRESLGDSAQNPRYIETLPRRGYRFIGEVREAVSQSAPLDTRAETAEVPEAIEGGPERIVAVVDQSARSRWRRYLSKPLLAVSVLLAVGCFLAFRRETSGPARTPPRVRSIAVLPMENLSGDPSQDCFVDAMTEELITDLAKASSLRVISRTSIMRYRGTTKGLPEIARELKVDAIVEGSVLRSGKRVRITAQLLHAPSDRHLWAERYERDAGDELSLQREVALAIAQQVQAQVEPKAAASELSARNTGSRPRAVWPISALQD
ncbi:MAG TPA: winged helix-turn-helix domain-containing protein [Terriglobales bacterium]|nr:winged helix-turn-helix domain-containing protein [Terriglobales bacterium]